MYIYETIYRTIDTHTYTQREQQTVSTCWDNVDHFIRVTWIQSCPMYDMNEFIPHTNAHPLDTRVRVNPLSHTHRYTESTRSYEWHDSSLNHIQNSECVTWLMHIMEGGTSCLLCSLGASPSDVTHTSYLTHTSNITNPMYAIFSV